MNGRFVRGVTYGQSRSQDVILGFLSGGTGTALEVRSSPLLSVAALFRETRTSQAKACW